MRILIVGDIHGDLTALRCLLNRAKRRHAIDAAIQVGDFGLYANVLSRVREPFPVPVHVIDGNHEDHALIADAIASGAVAGRWPQCWNIHYHERGTATEMDGAIFGWLGGALNVDRPQDHLRLLIRNEEPRACNWIRSSDCQNAIARWREKRPDVVITHSCPAGIGIGMTGDQELRMSVVRFITRYGLSAGPEQDAGEEALTRVYQHAFPDIRPAYWVFGHFHRWHQNMADGTWFLCVGTGDEMDGFPGLLRTMVYDTRLKIMEQHPPTLSLSITRERSIRRSAAEWKRQGHPVKASEIASAFGGRSSPLYRLFLQLESRSLRSSSGSLICDSIDLCRFVDGALQ